MKLRDKYFFLGNYNVSSIVDKLPSMKDPVWEKNTTRQTNYEAHKSTKSLVFFWSKNLDSEDNIKDEELLKSPLGVEVLSAVNTIAKRYESNNISKLMIAALPPGYAVDAHYDAGNLTKMRRIHIPLVSSKDCIFEIDGIGYSFPPGFVFELDNTRKHAVRNTSDSFRLHIIFDVIC